MVFTKKGVLVQYLLVFTILTISMSIGIFYILKDKDYSFNIGEVQQNVIRGYGNVDESKLYLRENLDLVTENITEAVLKNSGKYNPILIDEYTLWKKGDMECYPDEWNSIKENILLVLKEEVGDYDFEVLKEQENMVVKVNLVRYFEGGENYSVNYTEDVNFSSSVDFIFDDFLFNVDKIREVVEACGDNESCWDTSFVTVGKLVSVEDKLFKFEFTTPGIGEEIIVKAAIDFDSDYNFGQEELKC